MACTLHGDGRLTPESPVSKLLALVVLVHASLARAEATPASASSTGFTPFTLTSDGTAWELVRAPDAVRLRATDEDGHTRTVARWSPDSPTAPIACAFFRGGRVALARPAGPRFRLTVRDADGNELWLPLTLPARPDLFVAHPDLPFLLVRLPRPDGTARAWWIDLDTLHITERAVAPAGDDVRFGPGPMAWLDGVPFDAAPRVERPAPTGVPFDAP